MVVDGYLPWPGAAKIAHAGDFSRHSAEPLPPPPVRVVFPPPDRRRPHACVTPKHTYSDPSGLNASTVVTAAANIK